MDMRGEDQHVAAELAWMDTEAGEVGERSADPMVERAFADDEVEPGRCLIRNRRNGGAVSGAVAPDDQMLDLRKDTRDCPYISLPGRRELVNLQDGEVCTTPLPTV